MDCYKYQVHLYHSTRNITCMEIRGQSIKNFHPVKEKNLIAFEWTWLLKHFNEFELTRLLKPQSKPSFMPMKQWNL